MPAMDSCRALFLLVVPGLFFAAKASFDIAAQASDSQATTLRQQFQVALTDYRAKKFDAAEKRLETLAKQFPASFDVHELLGLVYSARGDCSKAIGALESAVRLKPDFAPARVNLARNLVQCGKMEEESGNYDRAAREFQRAALLDPSEKNIFEWGNELLVHHQLYLARQAFRRGVQGYPRSARTWVGLGVTLYALSDYAGAAQALLRASDLRPEDPRPYFFLANAYTLASNVPDAEGSQVTERLRRLMDGHPGNPQVLFYYAVCFWKQERKRGKQEDLNQAESLLKESERLDPNFPGVHLQLGIFYQGEGRHEEAIQELQQAIKLGPGLAVAHYRLGQLYAQTHQKALAEQEFQAFGGLNSTTTAADQEGRDIERFLASMKPSAEGP